MALVTSLMNSIGAYWQNGLLWVLYLASLIYLWIKKAETVRDIFIYGALIYFVAIFNPISYKVITSVILSEQTFSRLFWGLPTAIVIAYTLVLIIGEYGKKLYVRALALVGALALIMGCGTFIFTRSNFDWNHNKYGLPQVAVDMLDAIVEDADYDLSEHDINDHIESRMTVAFPEYACYYVLQYDMTLGVPYGNNGVGGDILINGYGEALFPQLSSLTPDPEAVMQAVDDGKVDYFATYFTADEQEYIDRGCRYLGLFESDHNGNYKLFAVDRQE